jgi:hypothetical protein
VPRGEGCIALPKKIFHFFFFFDTARCILVDSGVLKFKSTHPVCDVTSQTNGEF